MLQSLLQDEAEASFWIRTHLCYAFMPLPCPASISVLLLRTLPPSVNLLHLHCLSLCLQGTQAKRVPMNLLFSTFFFIYFHPLIQTPHTLTQKCIYSNLQAIITLIIELNKTTS